MAKKRILLVEDDPSVMFVTKTRLEHEGYEVVPATNGEVALQQAVDKLPIHVVLLDIMLPKVNGYEVCRRLKQQPATADIPVIIFTASEAQLRNLADRCTEVGASDWIKKPFLTKELLQKIQRVLGEEDSANA